MPRFRISNYYDLLTQIYTICLIHYIFHTLDWRITYHITELTTTAKTNEYEGVSQSNSRCSSCTLLSYGANSLLIDSVYLRRLLFSKSMMKLHGAWYCLFLVHFCLQHCLLAKGTPCEWRKDNPCTYSTVMHKKLRRNTTCNWACHFSTQLSS